MTDDQISNRDIMLEMRSDVKALMLAQAILGERVDHVISTQKEVKAALESKDQTLEARVKIVEDWKARIMGMLVVIGAGVGFLSALAKDAVANALHWGS